MTLAKIIALSGVLAMTIVLIYGFTIGDFQGEGSQLIRMPWGIVSLVDLYTGFILFSAWIVYREPVWWHAVIWVILMMVLGFFTASLYTFIALNRSQGNWQQFWLGKHFVG
jgi:hypothetical protein